MLININDQSESLGEPIIIAFKFFGFSFCFKKKINFSVIFILK